MGNRLSTAPRWVLALLYGVPFGVATAVFAAAMMTNLTLAGRVYVGVVTGLLGGASFGLVMAWFTSRQNSSLRAGVEDVPDDLLHVATRAAWRGPVPSDQAVRRVALRIVENTCEVNNRRRRSSAVVFSGLSLLYLALALTSSPWWWLAVASVAGFFAFDLTLRRRIKRRVAVLSEGSPTGG